MILKYNEVTGTLLNHIASYGFVGSFLFVRVYMVSIMVQMIIPLEHVFTWYKCLMVVLHGLSLQWSWKVVNLTFSETSMSFPGGIIEKVHKVLLSIRKSKFGIICEILCWLWPIRLFLEWYVLHSKSLRDMIINWTIYGKNK